MSSAVASRLYIDGDGDWSRISNRCHAASMGENLSFERPLSPGGWTTTRKRSHLVLKWPEIQEIVAEARERHALMSTKRARRYQRGSICRYENGEVWYGKYYPAPGAPQKRVQLGRTSEMDEKGARTALDDIVAALNRNPAHALGAEPVRRFIEQVYIPQKYENGDWRKV